MFNLGSTLDVASFQRSDNARVKLVLGRVQTVGRVKTCMLQTISLWLMASRGGCMIDKTLPKKVRQAKRHKRHGTSNTESAYVSSLESKSPRTALSGGWLRIEKFDDGRCSKSPD